MRKIALLMVLLCSMLFIACDDERTRNKRREDLGSHGDRFAIVLLAVGVTVATTLAARNGRSRIR